MKPEVKYTDSPARLGMSRALARLRHNRLINTLAKPLPNPLLNMIKEIIGIALLVCFMVAIFLILKLTILP